MSTQGPAFVPSDPSDPRARDGRLDVVAVGNALVDVLTYATDELVDRTGLAKGAMTLVDLVRASSVYGLMGQGREISGGSAANTAVGVAMLGGSAGYVGKVADDELGEVFVHDITAAGVEVGALTRAAVPDGADADVSTGRCLVLVTPDGERTMATHLGLASMLGPEDLDEILLARAEVVYLEGYLWDLDQAKAAMKKAMEVAHGADALVALSLSDPFCVRRHQRDFLDLLQGEIDVLFANEEEAHLLFGSRDLDDALGALSETGVLAAVTLGPSGSVVVGAGDPTRVEAEPVDRVVDTTGAGDLYAAGFIYGLTHGQDPERCARIGSVCAAEIISHIGARPEADLRSLVG